MQISAITPHAVPVATPAAAPAPKAPTLASIRQELQSPFGFMTPMSCPWGPTPPAKN